MSTLSPLEQLLIQSKFFQSDSKVSKKTTGEQPWTLALCLYFLL